MNKNLGGRVSKTIDDNIQMLTKQIMDYDYKYNGVLPRATIEKRLRAYTKTKQDDIFLSKKEYLLLSGYIKALEWVLSGNKIDTSLQKANLYTVEHKS